MKKPNVFSPRGQHHKAPLPPCGLTWTFCEPPLPPSGPHGLRMTPKVSDKLLGQLLALLAAKLKTACTKLVFVPRSL